MGKQGVFPRVTSRLVRQWGAVSEHEDMVASIEAGKHQVEDFNVGYGLYASFGEGRVGYRKWARRNGRLADIHSLDDRLDHDVDELMA
jgi:hypothetical protein